MNYKDIITIVSKELNLPYKVVDKTYKAYWSSIKSIIENLPLKEDLSQEEFNQLKTNFNIASIGKLSCTYDRYKHLKQKYKKLTKV